MTSPHAPVLLDEVIEALNPKPGDVMIDATFGAGGYTRAILDRGAAVVGLDRDPTVQPHAEAVAADFPGQFELKQTPFSGLSTAFAETRHERLDGAVFDIGVSSMQLDQAERGFSFMRDGNTPGGSRHAPMQVETRAPSFTLLFKGAREAGEVERAANPRARSARLRAAVRTDAPPWGRMAA